MEIQLPAVRRRPREAIAEFRFNGDWPLGMYNLFVNNYHKMLLIHYILDYIALIDYQNNTYLKK